MIGIGKTYTSIGGNEIQITKRQMTIDGERYTGSNGLSYDQFGYTPTDRKECLTLSSIETTKIDPVVIGLTDTQIIGLEKYLKDRPHFGILDIRDYLNKQNFDDPIAVGLTDEQIEHLVVCIVETVYARKLGCSEDTCDLIEKTIVKFLGTETFNIGLSKEIQPNIGNVPKWANWIAQDSYGRWVIFEKKPSINQTGWFDNGGESVAVQIAGWEMSLKQIREQVPIEVGQSFVGDGYTNQVRVVAITQIQEQEFVVVETTATVKTYPSYPIKEFQSKFVRV